MVDVRGEALDSQKEGKMWMMAVMHIPIVDWSRIGEIGGNKSSLLVRPSAQAGIDSIHSLLFPLGQFQIIIGPLRSRRPCRFDPTGY
jgi:hypothetical protein